MSVILNGIPDRGKRTGDGVPGTMADNPKCERCGKEAIGIQSFGCCTAYVCREHADDLLLALKPGERKAYDECFFERFGSGDQG